MFGFLTDNKNANNFMVIERASCSQNNSGTTESTINGSPPAENRGDTAVVNIFTTSTFLVQEII